MSHVGNNKRVEHECNGFGPKTFGMQYHCSIYESNFTNVQFNNVILAMRSNPTVGYYLIALLCFTFETEFGKVSIFFPTYLEFNAMLKSSFSNVFAYKV